MKSYEYFEIPTECNASFTEAGKFLCSLYCHIPLMLDRPEPNQCIILSYPALLWPCPSKALSWDCSSAVLHEYWFCHTCPRSASIPNLLCLPHPESALVLTCNELNAAPLDLYLLVPLGCPSLSKSL